MTMFTLPGRFGLAHLLTKGQHSLLGRRVCICLLFLLQGPTRAMRKARLDPRPRTGVERPFGVMENEMETTIV